MTGWPPPDEEVPGVPNDADIPVILDPETLAELVDYGHDDRVLALVAVARALAAS